MGHCYLWRVAFLGLFWFPIFLASLGCANYNYQKAITAEAEQINYPANLVSPRPTSEGSLWQDNGRFTRLFKDHKAMMVGDVVTVSIVESSSASNNAGTKTGRTSSMDAQMQAFFNLEKDYPASHPFFNPFSSVKGGMDSQFDGSGTTSRSGKLNAFITARITEVLPNGNFRIMGARNVTVNNEDQFITLSGIVRPEDISSQNVILSTYIANAEIKYSGSGVVNDRQRPGWMGRVFDWVWPF